MTMNSLIINFKYLDLSQNSCHICSLMIFTYDDNNSYLKCSFDDLTTFKQNNPTLMIVAGIDSKLPSAELRVPLES